MCITIIESKTKGSGWLKRSRTVSYKQGYMIIISGNFYEVADGKILLFFGRFNHKPTTQEIWNKIIRPQERENVPEQRAYKYNRKRYFANHSR